MVSINNCVSLGDMSSAGDGTPRVAAPFIAGNDLQGQMPRVFTGDLSGQMVPWLRAQVRVLRPQIIVCLGRIAAQRLIDPDFRVTREHGVFREKGGILFMGTFHPAALLRNSAQKKDALADFQALRDKMEALGL